MNCFNKRNRIWGLAAMVAGLLLPAARGANVLQTFFVPLPEDSMQISLKTIDNAGGVGDEIQAAISMVVGTDGTILYYDHWEDGYEDDLTAPTQTTSQVWGDANPDNGYPPGFPDDLLTAGDVVRLEGTIDVTRNSVTIEYDGRDKVATTYPIAMTRGMYALVPGEMLAEAIGVYDTGTHGTYYRAPVGEGTGSGANTNALFSYTALYIMADYDFTRVDIDADNDGVFEDTVYLDQGEPYVVNGGVKAGATVQGSQPFQCQLVTGDIGSTWEMRWFELWPDSQWDSDFFSPAASRTNTTGTLITSHVFLFNPNAETITVTYATATNSGSIVIAPNSVSTPFQMPLNGGARFYSTNDSQFLGVDVFDTTTECQNHDWGIGLMPVRLMTTAGVVGWGPGQGTTGGGGLTNGNPIWVSSLTNTTLYVDYDSDPDTGPLVDPNGNRYDFSTNLSALQVVLLVDSNDIDQTGMRYYSLDGGVLMGAWGQDPSRATQGNPFLDMGYVIPAFPTVLSRKFATLLDDVNANGYADSGDTIEYYVDIINVGFATANNVTFQDEPPTNLTAYVTNSAMLAGGGSTNAVPDSLPPKLTRFPFDEGGYNVGTIALGQTTTVRYVTQVLTNLPSDFDGYIHNNATVGGTNGNWTGGWTIPVRIGGLSIQKQTSTTNLLEPGSNFTYTVTVANTGVVTYTGVNIMDTLPLGVTYVSNSVLVQISGARTNTVRDRFNVRSFTNSNGTIPWRTAWAEIGESDGVGAGGVQVLGDVMTNSAESYALQIGNASRGATRQADLSGHTNAILSFGYRRVGLDGATDAVGVYISSNNWASSNLLVNIQGTANDNAYVTTNFNVTAYITTNTGLRVLSTATMGASDFIWFDDVTFTLAGSNATFAGTAPPALAENLTLPPGGTATVTMVVQVVNPPVATQVVNTARTRADQEPWIDSNPVTNRINATEGITLLKTSSTTNLVGAGSNVTYTILISNTGTVAQTGIRLEDLLPFGMTYSNGTARLYRPFAHTNEFIDLFDRQAYTNSDGNVAWAGDWTEIGDDNTATGGNVRIAVDGTSIPGQTYALRTVSTSVVQRAASLAGYTSATLWFDYRRVTLDAGDFVNINVSSNGGASFTQVGQVGGATNDGSYFSQSFNISAYATTGTVIRFGGNASRDGTDIVWLDNIRIAVSAANATNALPPPPALLEDYTLPPGTNMTVTLTATVDDPITATNFVNTARLQSDQQTTWLTSRVTNAAAGTAGMRLTKSTALATNWNYGVTNDYYLTIENTGTVALTGLKLTDALPPGVTFVSNSAAIVELLWVTTNAFTETVSDGFGTASYDNNDGSVNWAGSWNESEDGDPATGSEVVRTAGGTNALVFELTNADNDHVTRTNQLSSQAGRTYTNMTLSFSYRRENWDANDSMTFYISTNGFASQSNLVYTVPSEVITDAAYTNITTNITSFIGSRTSVALRVRAGPNFAAGDRINFDFITFTNQGYDVATNLTAAWSNGVQVNVVSNLTTTPTNLLTKYTLAAGSSVTVRVRGTLNVPLVSTQFVNTATATNNQTPPQSALVTNVSVANSVGDYVWRDVVADGVQSLVEPEMSNVVVKLYDSSTNLVLTTTSGVTGAYAFTNLPSGSYFLEFVTPTNFLPTTPDQGGDDALDSDIATNTGRTAIFTLAGGTNDTTRDAGYYQPSSSLGNFVWRDVDGDGIQDGGSETGMPGVVVTLYDGASNVVNVTTTDTSGAYSFTSLNTGTFFLQFTPPTNFTFTLQDQGGSDAADSDVSPVTGRTAPFHLPPGIFDDSRDAGLAPVVYGLTITKTSSAGSCLAGGDTNTYTIVVQNTGTVAQSGIAVEDVMPPGLTYVSNSISAVFNPPLGGGAVTSVTYNASGNFVVPAGVTSITAQAWGGGGGARETGNTTRRSGGGGAAFAQATFGVTPGTTNNVVVGAGGAAADPGQTGGSSYVWIPGATNVLAVGGGGAPSDNTAGIGGAAGSCIGSITYSGGNGGLRGTIGGGGGGGSAYTNANGSAGGAGGAALGGAGGAGTGAGGDGGDSGQPGENGNAPGGGGGGEGDGSAVGGDGAAGRVIVFYQLPGTNGTFGAPPNLWSGGTLATGASVTITFKATVNSPLTVTQFLNTASTYSAVQPVRQASVTNCAQVADVGVRKTATDTNPDQVQIIEYLLTVTNNGPEVATGLAVTDAVPAQVQYNSHSNGNYNAGTGIWTIGTLGVGAATTLYINVTVREGTGGLRITNTATISARNLFDPVSSNDTSSVVIVPKGGASIGDRVWFDANRDGIQDAGETNGIANLPVSLMTTNGTVVTSIVTAADGTYLFQNILPGTYYIRFNLTNVTPNVGATTNDAGGNDSLDSDVIASDTNRYYWTTNYVLTGGQTNRTVDLGLRSFSTRADLAEVWGEWTGGRGRVAWRTISEWNTAGFHVYRVDPETGAEARVNDDLVASAFRESGAVYELVDPEAREGGAQTYRLEEVELSGQILGLGTHAVVFGAPPPAAKAARAELRALARAAAKPVRQSGIKRAGPSGILKVMYRAEGLYGVALQAIADGMGRDLGTVESLAAAGMLRFVSEGSPLPTLYDAAQGRLVFHGRPTDNWYTRDNAVLIFEGAGRSMPRRTPGAAAGTAMFPVQVHFEEDRYPFDSLTELPEDFYYWDYVISGNPATGTRTFPLDLTGASGDVTLTVRLQGWSSTTNDPDHLAEFRFNGTLVGSAVLDGQDVAETELSIPAGMVSNGVNTLSVKGVLQAGRTHSYFVVDWIEAAFTRELAPLAGTAHFRAGGAAAVSAAAFTAPLAFAVDDEDRPVWIADEAGALPDKAWAAATADERFAVIEAGAVPMLAPEAVDDNPWFLAETNRIDYLIVVSRALTNAVQELADYRAGQGLRTGVAVFEDLCDWMAGGLRTPEAIPEMLSYAAAYWAEAPWMVVLAGSGHYDYLGALSNEVNHLPPMMLQTGDGIFAADGLLADAGGDDLPDVALGRLPALTEADLTAMIAKIKAYEGAFGAGWQQELVFANDQQDVAGGFAAANARMAALAGDGFTAEQIDLDTTTTNVAIPALLGWFNNGAGIIHYTGHGGVANWSAKGLLKKVHVDAMTNAPKPVVVALSCLVGRFEAPGPSAQSLGELLLRRAQGGAVAAWGPSGLSRNDPAAALGEAFYEAVLQDGSGTLGLAILRAVRGLDRDLYSRDTLAVYNLLGDPALRIAGNTVGTAEDGTFAQWRWQRFSPAALADPETSGATHGNFFDYAMGGGYDLRAERPEFGYPLDPDDEGGFILRWKRRIRRSDIDYQLFLSSDLEQWAADSADVETVGVEPDPDGIMETVRTRVTIPVGARIFLGIKAVRK